MKAMCPPGYHHNGFVATHAWVVPKCMSCHKAIVVIVGRTHCFHDWIHITPILLRCVSWITYDHIYIYAHIYNKNTTAAQRIIAKNVVK